MKPLAALVLRISFLFALSTATLAADTLLLKSGEKIEGYFEGGNSRLIKFRTLGNVTNEYDLLNIQRIEFGEERRDIVPRLRSDSDRSNNTVPHEYSLPSGFKISIRMIDSISSEKQKVGDRFMASLDQPIILDGVEVVSKGADLQGRIATLNDAGRIAGAIAGGGKGAAIGAGVGAGGATAVQVLTKGEKLNIPSETKLEFTLRESIVLTKH